MYLHMKELDNNNDVLTKQKDCLDTFKEPKLDSVQFITKTSLAANMYILFTYFLFSLYACEKLQIQFKTV